MADQTNALPGFALKKRKIIRKTPLAKVSRKRGRNRSLRKKLWPELSKRIRARDGHCLMEGDFGMCAGPLQGSHIYPKGKYPLLELYPLNVKTLCYRHHFFVWGNNPLDMAAWLRRKLGDQWIEQLIAMKNDSLWRKHMTEVEIRVEWSVLGI